MTIIVSPRALLVAVLIVGAAVHLPACAQSRSGGHAGGAAFQGGNAHGGRMPGNARGGNWHGNGGWSRGGAGWWGVGLGLGLGWDAGFDSDPYYYPPYSPPVVVVEPSTPPPDPQTSSPLPSAPAASASWYYCEPTKAYYPYVRECAEPWRIVPAVPTVPVAPPETPH